MFGHITGDRKLGSSDFQNGVESWEMKLPAESLGFKSRDLLLTTCLNQVSVTILKRADDYMGIKLHLG